MTRAADKIGELMVTDVVTVSPDDSVADAVRVMVDRNIGCVVAEKEGRPIGVFTERDVLRCLAGDENALGRTLGDLMSQPPVTIAPDLDVYEAFELMSDRGFRRLPVVDADGLVGIVTENDLLRWVKEVANE